MTTIQDDFIKRSADIRWPDGLIPPTLTCSHTMRSSSTRQRRVSGQSSSSCCLAHLVFERERRRHQRRFWPAREGCHLQLDNLWSQGRQEGCRLRPLCAPELVREQRSVACPSHVAAHPPLGDSTYVVMEEVSMGDGAQHLALTNPGYLHRGHELWNISLKFADARAEHAPTVLPVRRAIKGRCPALRRRGNDPVSMRCSRRFTP